MKSILFFAAVALLTSANPIDYSAFLPETENSGYDNHGHKLYQGDIVLDEEELELLNGSSIDKRKARRDERYRWPDARVPWRIHASSEGDRDVIVEAMQHWAENTCVQFENVSADYSEPHLIFRKLKGCYSHIGKKPEWAHEPGQGLGQDISIGDSCASLGVVAHEIGHALGFRHEQARPDRGEHVLVLNRNAECGKKDNFFMEEATDTFGVPYDLGSLMHYGVDGFSINNKNTMVTIDPFKNFLIGQRDGLSFWDIKLANLVYKCSDVCENPPTCNNSGYVDRNCFCVCPPGFTGISCDEGSAAPAAVPCGGALAEPTVIQSPRHSSEITQCVWVVTAPEGHKVHAHFNKFKLLQRHKEKNWCVWDILELRTHNLHDGVRYCGNDLLRRTVTSVSNTMVLLYNTKQNLTEFQANITFV